MEYFKSTKHKIAGTSFKEVNKTAKIIFRQIESKTKRTPYVRSKYFKKDKIFLTLFWGHLFGKRDKDKIRRLKFFDCAIDVIKNSNYDPDTKENFKKKDELLHRFSGVTTNKEKFVVQIKENKRTKRKDLISIYPE